MESPQEIEVWYILPAIRKAIAEELLKLGLKQKDIAEKLDVTGAAVSQYLKSKRASQMKFTGTIKAKITESAKRIANGQVNMMEELQKLCTIARKEGILCKIHKKHSSADLKCCKICDTR